MNNSFQDDMRLIEAGFPCHQVGAETQRERGASSALPPLYYLHVWWARRPLTPSRAAILASLLPADTDPDWFLRQLGIEKRVVEINGVEWTLIGKLLDKIKKNENDQEVLPVDSSVLALLEKENERRRKNRLVIKNLKSTDSSLANEIILTQWEKDSIEIPAPFPAIGTTLSVIIVSANPAQVNERIQFAKLPGIKQILGKELKWDAEDLYGYKRAFTNSPQLTKNPKVVLDPTSGGGSIPFEALRLGHKVIANELNPVASVILHATLEYPAKFGVSLIEDIKYWGEKLVDHVAKKMDDITPFSPLPRQEKIHLKTHCKNCPEIIPQFDTIEYDQIGLIYCRQVTCPHCNGNAPLLNTCWLSKQSGKQWGVKIIPDGKQNNGTVRFETYRISKEKGPKGEDPGFATVNRGVGHCIHCKQAIDADEIKSQARGESPTGKWKDLLYCIVAVRFQPKLDKDGKPQRYKSGAKKGEIKTEKVRFFRPPNEKDLSALKEADKRLKDNWDRWDEAGLIPTEKFPQGNDMRPVIYGMSRWCDMFTSRQLLGHLTLVEDLNRLKPQIIDGLGEDKGKAVVTYLQFAIDKGVDYNSRQTRWEYTRGVIKGTFGRHDFSLKWTFGEMIFTGPNSGFAWGLSQIVDAYKGLSELSNSESKLPTQNTVTINNGTAAHLSNIQDMSVDLVCMDPPYYNNVQYAELSDYFYVWQKRTLNDLYPDYFNRRLTNKQDEAVANPNRDGGSRNAHKNYERMMSEIFNECRRVIKNTGLLTVMFTHKSQTAWEALTQSLIETGWNITASFPVESETQHGIHTKETASAISSVFLSCRKRNIDQNEPATWSGFGGTGVQQKIRQAVKQGLEEFKVLKLNPVDEMVASYGRALRVLSEQWPVLDGDEPVGPVRAMNEASRVVAENQIYRITDGQLNVEDLSPEASMALTLYGIYGLKEFRYDEALNLSRSLNIRLETKTGGYTSDGRFIGINTQSNTGRRARQAKAEDAGFHAPLIKKGSKLRLARPDERNQKRIENPQTEWDILHGLIMNFRKGDVPVARGYLSRHAEGKENLIKNLINVWASEMTDEDLRKEGNAIVFGI